MKTFEQVKAEYDAAVELADLKRELAVYDAVLSEPIDNYTVQSAAICYGGDSFPGPIKEALECYQAILQSRIDAKLGESD